MKCRFQRKSWYDWNWKLKLPCLWYLFTFCRGQKAPFYFSSIPSRCVGKQNRVHSLWVIQPTYMQRWRQKCKTGTLLKFSLFQFQSHSLAFFFYVPILVNIIFKHSLSSFQPTNTFALQTWYKQQQSHSTDTSII